MTDPTRNGWARCPRGTFVRLTADLAARRARHVWLTALGVTVGVALTAAACWQTAAALDDWQHGRWGGRPAHQCQPAPCPPACPP